MSEIWCCYKVNIMMDRFSSCQCGNNCKQTRKWKQKSPQCSIFSIKNKWIPESDWMSVNTLKIQSFLICEILIKLRMISIVLLHSYKESNQKTAFLDGGGILDLFYWYFFRNYFFSTWPSINTKASSNTCSLAVRSSHREVIYLKKINQNQHFLKVYFICTAKFMNSWIHEIMKACLELVHIISNVHQLLTNIQRRNI